MRFVLLDGLADHGELAPDADEFNFMTEFLQPTDHVVFGLAQFCFASVEFLARPVGHEPLVGQKKNAQAFRDRRSHRDTFGKPSCKTPAVCSVRRTSSFSKVTSGGSMTRRPRLCARAIICRRS